jgi:hypothetical protein
MALVRTADVTAAILEDVAAAVPLARIASKHGVSVAPLSVYLRGLDEYTEAKIASAEVHIQKAEELLREAADSGAGLTSAQASVVRERANWHRWIAGVRNRDEYGDRPSELKVELNVGMAHLQALMENGQRRRLPIPEAEYELVEEDE